MTPGPSPDHAFIEFVHRSRVAVGGAFLALAVGCLAVAGYCGFRGLKDAFRPADPAAAAVVEEKPAEPKPAGTELDPRPYQMGMAAALIASLGLGGVGAFFVGGVPSADPAERRRRDRVLLLVGGYAFGLANRLSGLFLFVHWFDKLGDWVNGVAGSHKTGWMPVAALLQYLLGAGITFLATVPARSEERNRPWVRRGVYAVNFALSAVLLVVGLVLVNAVVAMKLPDKLDTTSTGFYTLTDKTTKYLDGLKQPVKAYAITTDVNPNSPDARTQTDALRLLAGCRRVNPGRFEVVQLSPVTDRAKIEELLQKYPTANLRTFGVLLTAGDNFERYEFVDFDAMKKEVGPRKEAFVGESALIAGMMALTEKKAVAYFTQVAREPYLDRPADPTAAAAGRPATRLKELLEGSQCEARPWVIDPLAATASVPPDADVVVVLDPLDPLPPSAVAALDRYMKATDPKAKKGLLVFAPPRAGEGGTLLRTGLEPLLADFGVGVFDRQVYAQPIEAVPADAVTIQPLPQEVARQNPLAVAVASGVRPRGVRVIQPATQDGRAASGMTNLLLVVGDPRNVWVEAKPFTPPRKAWDDLLAADSRGDREYVDARKPRRGTPYSVGVYATDPAGKPAVAAFGFADGLTDDAANTAAGRATPALLSAGVNWLRERPAGPDITPKEYAEYTPRKGVSGTSLFTVPFVGTLIAIVILGLGVWAVRRK